MRVPYTPFSFFEHAVGVDGSAAPLVFGRVAAFGAWAFMLSLINYSDHLPDVHISVAPYEVAGAALGLLMVMRTNGGYDRWWEGRKLWGAIVNGTRSLAISAAAYGPEDPVWRARVGRRIATFAHVCRRSLRGQRTLPEVAALLGQAEADRLAACEHMPTAAALDLAREFREALPDFAFLQSDTLRVQLIDNLGGCERIAKSPLPLAYAIEVRRFIFLFLLTLPLVLLGQLPHNSQILWAVPLLTLLVAYPFVAIDKIGHELQHPFDIHRLNHLPLDDITATIERNVLAVLDPHGLPADDGVLVADIPLLPAKSR